jgi:hypothetical protein
MRKSNVPQLSTPFHLESLISRPRSSSPSALYLYPYLCLFFILSYFFLPSAHAADWAKNYGTAGQSTYVTATAIDSSGNVYIAGYFDGATLAMDSVTLTRIGTRDAFAAKLNSSGTVTWAKNYGGAGATTTGYGIAVDSSGNVYVAGYFSGASLTTPALTKIGTQDVFALKLDSSGATT